MRKKNMNSNQVCYLGLVYGLSGISGIVMKRLCLGLKPEKGIMVLGSVYVYGNMASQIDLKFYYYLGISSGTCIPRV